MGVRRGRRRRFPAAPRHHDGRPLLGPGEAQDIDDLAAQALDRVNNRAQVAVRDPDGVERFDIANWNRQHRRDLEIEAERRARALPVRAAAATAALEAGGWGAAAVAELLAGPAGYLIATASTPAVAAVVLLAVRLAHRQRISEWSGLFNRAAVTGLGLVSVASAVGPVWWPLHFLAAGVGALLVSAPWRAAHREVIISAAPVVRASEPRPALEVGQSVPLDDIEAFAARWHRDIARRDGKAAGSALSDGHGFDNGLEYLLEMAGGMVLPQLQSRAMEIASVLDCDPMQLVFDDPPRSAAGWRSARRAMLRYVTHSPITQVVDWTEPHYGDGRCGLGPHADGQGWGEWELFAENSMRNGVIIGSTGSGKSGMINGLVATARSSRKVVTVYLDAKGDSSPELAQSATVTTLGLDQAEEFTTAVEALLYGRRLESGLNGWSGFEPRTDRPGYLVVIDECDMLFALRGMAHRWGVIAKTCRSRGAGLLLATQIAGVAAFGNNEMLRSNVARFNVALMRTESPSSGGQLIAPELPDSRSLPGEPGYAYLKAPGTRRAPLRAAYLRSAQNCPDGFNALTALQAYPDAPLCPIGQRAFAAFLAGTPEQRREQNRAHLQAQLSAFLGGGEATVSPPCQASGLEHLAERIPQALTGDNVIAIRRPSQGPASATCDDRLTDTDRRVLAAVQAGHVRSYQIVNATGLRNSAVSKSAAKLAKRGLLADGGHGKWALPDQQGVGS